MICFIAAVCAAEDVTLEELKRRAEAAEGGRRADLYVEVAQRQIETADSRFTEGKIEEGQEAVEDAVAAAEKASNAAVESRSRMKQTEIALRRASRRLADISRTLAFDDRKRTEEAVIKLEKIRTDLLEAMFAPKKKDKS
ncbi:MAG TPA: hypothetical protein VNK82_06485 [Terriglobales bacterium]|nr:hypothetical protein [Terriglobales bacterium]